MFYPSLSQAHDAARLLTRWQALAGRAGLHATVLCHAAEYPVLALESSAAVGGAAAVYLSAGVHGDEAAPPWALLRWAEQSIQTLRKGSFLILPCLNPVGLLQNTRLDGRGLDLNRRFHLPRDPLSGAWQRWIASRPLLAALCLHEDYDAEGCYVYELGKHRAAVSPRLLREMQQRHAVIMPDSRGVIDGQRARQGVIRRKKPPRDLPGMPEAIELVQRGSPLTLTFETPSEQALRDRIDCHQAFIETALLEVSS